MLGSWLSRCGQFNLSKYVPSVCRNVGKNLQIPSAKKGNVKMGGTLRGFIPFSTSALRKFNIAIEHSHWNSEFSHQTWWFKPWPMSNYEAINSGFTHKKWWLSIVMLVYQRVSCDSHSISFPSKSGVASRPGRPTPMRRRRTSRKWTLHKINLKNWHVIRTKYPLVTTITMGTPQFNVSKLTKFQWPSAI